MYQIRKKDGSLGWAPIIRKPYLIKVAGEKEPRKVIGLFTRRGPLRKNSILGKGWYSRQWLALKPSALHADAIALLKSKSLDDFDTRLKNIEFPSQNVVFMDHVLIQMYHHQCNMQQMLYWRTKNYIKHT